MNARYAILVSGLLVPALCAVGVERVPAERRIEARVVRTLVAPADQPMHMPTDVAVDASGQVFVADGTNDRIVRFRSDGSFDGVIAQWDSVTLSRPIGLSVDSQQRLWITDTGHHRLLVTSGDGQLMERIDLPPLDQEPFDPTGVAITADGKRTYIVDNDHHRIAIRDNTTGAFKILGRFGSGLGRFRWPFMVCVGSNGDAYVSDVIGARVQRLSRQDRWAGQVGRSGVELGQFYRPKGVAVDAKGQLYVTDSSLGVVEVFSERGGVRGVLTDAEGMPLRFQHPMGLCLDTAGRLYVVELNGDRVAVVALPPGFGVVDTQPADAGHEGGAP